MRSIPTPKQGEKYCDHTLDLKVSGILETGGSEEEYIYVTLDDVSYLTLSSRSCDIVEVSVAASKDELKAYLDEINKKSDAH